MKKSDEKSFLFLSIYFFFYSSIPHWDVKNKDTLQCNYYVYPNKTDTKSNDFLFMSFACTFPTPPSSSFDRQYYWETEAAFRLMRRPRVPVRTISLIDCSWAISNRRYSACCDFQLWQKNQKFIKNSIKTFIVTHSAHLTWHHVAAASLENSLTVAAEIEHETVIVLERVAAAVP